MYDGVANSLKLYQDCYQVASCSGLTLGPNSISPPTQRYVGRSAFAADPYWDGRIRNVQFYDFVLRYVLVFSHTQREREGAPCMHACRQAGMQAGMQAGSADVSPSKRML